MRCRGLLASEDVGLILLDMTMPHVSGDQLLSRLKEEYPDVTVIVVSGLNQVETAVSCMQLGAFDYIVKGVDNDRLLDTVRRAIRVQELERENRAMRQHLLGGDLRASRGVCGDRHARPGHAAGFSVC